MWMENTMKTEWFRLALFWRTQCRHVFAPVVFYSSRLRANGAGGKLVEIPRLGYRVLIKLAIRVLCSSAIPLFDARSHDDFGLLFPIDAQMSKGRLQNIEPVLTYWMSAFSCTSLGQKPKCQVRLPPFPTNRDIASIPSTLGRLWRERPSIYVFGKRLRRPINAQNIITTRALYLHATSTLENQTSPLDHIRLDDYQVYTMLVIVPRIESWFDRSNRSVQDEGWNPTLSLAWSASQGLRFVISRLTSPSIA